MSFLRTVLLMGLMLTVLASPVPSGPTTRSGTLVTGLEHLKMVIATDYPNTPFERNYLRVGSTVAIGLKYPKNVAPWQLGDPCALGIPQKVDIASVENLQQTEIGTTSIHPANFDSTIDRLLKTEPLPFMEGGDEMSYIQSATKKLKMKVIGPGFVDRIEDYRNSVARNIATSIENQTGAPAEDLSGNSINLLSSLEKVFTFVLYRQDGRRVRGLQGEKREEQDTAPHAGGIPQGNENNWVQQHT
ncbi:hypothetical protein EV361DRAFT_953797 [Lentinula raphanica]|nr:hypothetical protein EV361DRAFT_953797 [Lentinula raphanica]